jgi:4-carboxymuconolactone decarboxylase
MTEPSPAQRAVGDFAPKLVELTDDVLFGDVWERSELPKRDRSLITVASLITSGSVEQLVGHLRLAKQNGLSEAELKEAIIHLAFYAGWPKGNVGNPGRQASLRRVARHPVQTRAVPSQRAAAPDCIESLVVTHHREQEGNHE